MVDSQQPHQWIPQSMVIILGRHLSVVPKLPGNVNAIKLEKCAKLTWDFMAFPKESKFWPLVPLYYSNATFCLLKLYRERHIR